MLIFATCVSAQCFGHPLPPADTGEESEVRRFVDDFAAAFQNNDVNRFAPNFAVIIL